MIRKAGLLNRKGWSVLAPGDRPLVLFDCESAQTKEGREGGRRTDSERIRQTFHKPELSYQLGSEFSPGDHESGAAFISRATSKYNLMSRVEQTNIRNADTQSKIPSSDTSSDLVSYSPAINTRAELFAAANAFKSTTRFPHKRNISISP